MFKHTSSFARFIAATWKSLLAPRRSPHRHRRQLLLEVLEDRIVPALLNPLPSALAKDEAKDTDGKLSLREAIIRANKLDATLPAKNKDDIVIQLQGGFYRLSQGNYPIGQDNEALTGDLDIRFVNPAHRLIIQGPQYR